MLATYPSIDVDRIETLLGGKTEGGIPMGGNCLLVQWEEKPEFLKTESNVKLVSPTLTKQWQYTGIVLKIGPWYENYDQIEVGDRVFFDQFSGMRKFLDDKYGRVAIIPGWATLLKVPHRTSVDSEESEYAEI